MPRHPIQTRHDRGWRSAQRRETRLRIGFHEIVCRYDGSFFISSILASRDPHWRRHRGARCPRCGVLCFPPKKVIA